MTKKLEFKGEGGVTEKVQRILGLRPKPKIPLVDDRRRVDIVTLINFTKVIEDSNYKNICGELEELKKGGPEDLKFIAKNTKSIDVCMAIVNGDFPEEVKELAEKRLATIGSEFDEIRKICSNIRKLENIMKQGYVSIEESAELLQENINLSNEIKKLGERDLFDLVADTTSLHVCQTIAHGNYPEHVQAIAEGRMKQIKA